MEHHALFVDLDNTLITTRSGKKYPIHSEDWKFIPEMLDAIQYYNRQNYMIIIVSNQLGIEQGYVIEPALVSKLEKICKVLEKELRIAPQSIHYHYSSKQGFDTMPKAGMIHELAYDHEIDTHVSTIVGSNNDTRTLAKNLNMNYLSIVEVINIDWINK